MTKIHVFTTFLLIFCFLVSLCESQYKIPQILQPGHIVSATKDLEVFSSACPDDDEPASKPIGKVYSGEKLLYKGGAVSYQGCYQYYVQMKGGFVAFSKGYRCLFLYECSNFVFKDEEKNVTDLLPMVRVPAPPPKQKPLPPIITPDGNEKLASFLISFGIFSIIIIAIVVVGVASYLYKNEVSRRRRFAQAQQAQQQDKQLEEYDSPFEQEEDVPPPTTIDTSNLMDDEDEVQQQQQQESVEVKEQV